MFLWQLKNGHRYSVSWLQLGCISAFLHLCILILFFFVYSDGSRTLSVTIDHALLKYDVEVLLRQAQSAPRRAHNKRGNVGKKGLARKANGAKKSDTKKAQEATSLTAQKEQSEQMSVKEKQDVIKKKKNVTKNKTKKTSVQDSLQNNGELKKQEPEKRADDQTKEKVVPQDDQQEIKDEKIVQPPAAQEQVLEDLIHPEVAPVADLVYDEQLPVTLGDGQYDQETLLRYAALQQEFVRCWQPPEGIADECVCEIMVAVGPDGRAHTVSMKRSSQVLMYDVAARKAIHEMEFPRWIQNKTLTITFKQ